MHESILLDDMRLMGALAGARNFTDLARLLGMPKQTVSRRIGHLEEALGVRLVDRTTRSFRLTALGRSYVERCAEIVRGADELNRAVRGEATEVSGTLRITADPLFGELFLPPLIADFLRKRPLVRVDVVLTSRPVNLVEEGFDLAFRVGPPPDASLVATRIADATMALVASPGYLAARGTPRRPEDLARHACIALMPEGGAPRWAFRDGDSIRWMPIAPHLRVNHLALARQAALAGIGIANLPYFSCADDVERGVLRMVLPRHAAPFGAIYVVHPPRPFLIPRIRAFRDLAVAHLAEQPELHARPRRAAPRKRTTSRARS